MKHTIIKLSDILKHPNCSLSPKDYLMDKNKYYDTCPKVNCNGNVVAERFELSSSQAYRNIRCTTCDYVWQEVFIFSHNEDDQAVCPIAFL